MKQRMTRHKWILVLTTLLGALLTAGCSVSDDPPPPGGVIEGEYQPPFVPVKLVVDIRGHVSIELGWSITTPVGRFSVEAAKQLNPDNDYTNVVVEHADGEADVFQIQSTRTLYVSIDGKATVAIAHRKTVISAMKGTKTTITILDRPIADNKAQISTAEPGLVLSRSNAAALETFIATATGFSPDETVRLSWTGPSSGTVGTYIADSQGKVSIAVMVDETDPPGSYTVTATGLTSGRSASAALHVVEP